MLNSWFGSKSSRHSHSRKASSPPALEHASDASSVTRSLQTPGDLTSASDVPLDEVHAHINDPSVYAPTPSLIHSADKEAGTLRTPDAPTASLDAPTYQRDSVHIAKQVAAPDHLDGTPFTPQDAIVAQVFAKSIPPATDRAHGTPPPPPPAQPSVSLMTRTSDSLPPPPSTSMQTPPSLRVSPPGPTLTIYDPFSGVKLGEHTPMSPSTATATATPGDPGLSCAAPTSTTVGTAADDRRLWSSLERILELQAEIAAMHAGMEGVGGRGTGNVHAGAGGIVMAGEGVHAGPKKRSRRGQTLPIGDEEPEEHVTGGAVSEISTEHSEGEDEGEEDDDEDDIHGYGKRRRDEEFARLAEQFAQRKVAIGGIMNKLDDLSMALKTFHTLPPPLFDLAMPPSRTDTMSSSPSNASVPSSPPPFHVYPGRSSSPFSSISPSQAVPITPPIVPPSPPIPPISTLAPPLSSEDSNAPGAVVAPVLPRTASPRIIPGAPRVESPADMNPTQSVFHGRMP